MGGGLSITILINDRALPGFEAEHGFAALVERHGHTVLFDTGASPMLLRNAERLRIDLAAIEAIVLSHGHYDHTGGLDAVPVSAPITTVAGVDRPRYGVRPGVGSREIGFRGGPAARQRLRRIEAPVEVAPGIRATGPIALTHAVEDTGGPFFLDPQGLRPDPLDDDQALVIETDGAPIVLLGCAHRGVVNTLEATTSMTGASTFEAVLGGMHLNAASEDRLVWTLNEFSRREIRRLGPCHCTGEAAMLRLRELPGIAHLDCRAGARLCFDGNSVT